MSVQVPTVPDNSDRTATPEGFSKEDLTVRSDVLAAKVKDLLHEGNVRRITVKNDQGHTIMEIPVTVGVITAVVAPVLAAVAAIAALASNWEIEIHRSPDHTGDR